MGLVEPASSITDFALGIVAIGVALGLWRKDRISPHWSRAFASIGVAALLGGVHHGFLKSHETIATASWSTISMVIAIGITFILAATVATVLGDGRGRPLLTVRSISLVAFLVLAILGRATVSTLVITEGLVMITVVVLWMHAWRLGQPGVGLILVAIGASILAAGVRGSSLHVTFAGWEFDPTALYHLAQMPGLVLLYIAIQRRAKAVDLRPTIEQPSLSLAGGT